MSEREPSEQQVFLHRVRDGLDAGVEGLPADTLTRLRKVREQALATQSSRLRGQWKMLVPMGVAASVMVVGLWLHAPLRQSQESLAIDPLLLEDMARPDSDSDLYDNIEFYEWLSDGDRTASPDVQAEDM